MIEPTLDVLHCESDTVLKSYKTSKLYHSLKKLHETCLKLLDFILMIIPMDCQTSISTFCRW